MNHIYQSIWNASLGCWVAAPETASAAAGRGRKRRVQGAPANTATGFAGGAVCCSRWQPAALVLAAMLACAVAQEASAVPIMVGSGISFHVVTSETYVGGQIASGGQLSVDNGGSLDNNGWLENFGTLTNQAGGLLTNQVGGTLTN